MNSSELGKTLNSFEHRVVDAWSQDAWQDVTVLVAVSGGQDSVALLRSLQRIAVTTPPNVGRLLVAHFNHGWRAHESDADEQFVASLADSLQLEFHVGRTLNAKQTEAQAREDRYGFLHQTAKRLGARFVVTAHTANDQAETILHRIIRGTGLRGLKGIQPQRGLSEAVSLVRPLLWATRAEIGEYLADLGQTYRTDPSNADQRFTRNRLRHDLLPQLAQHYNPGVVGALLRLGSLAAEADEVLQRQINLESARCLVSEDDKSVLLDRENVIALPDFLQREVLASVWRRKQWPQQSMGFEQWKRLVQAIQTRSTICLPGGVQLRCDPGQVQLVRPASEAAAAERSPSRE